MTTKEPQFIELNRYRNVNKKEIEDAIKFLSNKLDKKETASWVRRYADHLTTKGGKLYLDDKQVIGNDERDDLMRELVYAKNSDVAPSRDAGYYKVKQRYANISRRNWMDFLKKQRVIRMTDNAPPKQKHGGRKLNRKGELEADLFFISKKDLENHIRTGAKDLYAVLNVVDRLTSYCKVYYVLSKEVSKVKEKLKQAADFFSEKLKVEKKQLTFYTDRGTEFPPTSFESLGVKHEYITVGPKVEQKNSHIQRVFHRLKNAKRIKNVQDGLDQSEKIVNESYNRIMKMTAEEAVTKYNSPEETKKLIQKYNAKREKADKDRRKALEVGDFVRIVVKSTKASEFYKAYRGKTYTREGFPVNEKNKNAPSFKGLSVTKAAYAVTETKGTNPRKYKVNNKWYSRDRLSEPMPYKLDKNGKKVLDYPDKKSEKLLKERSDKQVKEAKDQEEREQKQDEDEVFIDKPKKKEDKPKKKKRPKNMSDSVAEWLDAADRRVSERRTQPQWPQHKAEQFLKTLRQYKKREIKEGKVHDTLFRLAKKLYEWFQWHVSFGAKHNRVDFRKIVREDIVPILKRLIQ